MTELSASVDLPGSKSITNRAFLLAALASGPSLLLGALHSDDTIVMTECLRHLGVTVTQLDSLTTRIEGCGGLFSAPTSTLFVGNSGTTIRFVTAAAALAPAGSTVHLDGVPRMRQRPITDLVEALLQLGVTAKMSKNGCPPVSVTGGGIRGGQCLIKGSVSSQYLSALLIAAPYADADVSILVDGDLVSRPYIDITLSMMAEFGINVMHDDYRSFFINSPDRYGSRTYTIEPDASNASYFAAAAAVTGGRVLLNGLGTSSIQGDIAVMDVFERMGCTVERSADSFTITGPATLSPIDFDASSIPDMAQTIAVAACFAGGKSRLTGLKTLRLKETDRITAMAIELRKIGAEVEEGVDYMVVTPAQSYHATEIETYDDHRMAMSFAVAGLKIDGLTINDPLCVTKTFPDFWTRWERLSPQTMVNKDRS